MDPRLVRLVEWLREAAAPAKRLLVPVSGGTGSSLCFWLCNQAYREKTVGVFFGDERNLLGREWLKTHGRIEPHAAHQGTPQEKEIRRWAALLEMSAAHGGWLVGSRNRSEDALGTYSVASR